MKDEIVLGHRPLAKPVKNYATPANLNSPTRDRQNYPAQKKMQLNNTESSDYPYLLCTLPHGFPIDMRKKVQNAGMHIIDGANDEILPNGRRHLYLKYSGRIPRKIAIP